MGALTEGKEKKPPVTEKVLFDACDSYFKQYDKDPTQKVMIKVVGGSAGTVGPMLRKWKEKRENDELAIMEMPDHIRDDGVTIIATWWQSIQPTINDMITTVQDMADKKVKLAEEKAKATIVDQICSEEENNELVKKVNGYEQQIKELKQAQVKSDNEVSGLKIAKAKVEGKLEVVEKQLIELKPENNAGSNASKKEQKSIEQESEMTLVKKAVQPADRKSKN